MDKRVTLMYHLFLFQLPWNCGVPTNIPQIIPVITN